MGFFQILGHQSIVNKAVRHAVYGFAIVVQHPILISFQL